MRDSTELCADEDKEKLAKVFRSFSSEIIEILRDDDNLREIGIRGDCVYAVYTSPLKTDIYECADKTNTNYSTQIAEKQETIASLNTEIVSIQKAIEEQKNTLKEKKTALKKAEKEVASLEEKKAKAE